MHSKPRPQEAPKAPARPRVHAGHTPPATGEPAPGEAGLAAPPTGLDPQTLMLVERMAMLEAEQKAARERIEQLTQAKISFEHAIARIRAQKEASVQQQAHTEQLLQELGTQIAKKENEQTQLREKIEGIRIQAEQEIATLRAERDAAMRLAEQRKHALDGMEEARPAVSWRSLLERHLHLALIAGSVLVVFFILLIILFIRLLA